MATLALTRYSIRSSDPQRMILFLSTLLEEEFSPTPEGFLLSSSVEFLVEEVSQEEKKVSNDSLSWKVNSKDELEELSSRYQFLIYRYSFSTPLSQNDHELILQDADGRVWRFYV